jgi:Protein of unknown function (DUF3618)
VAQDAGQERSEQLTADEPKSPERLRAEINAVRLELGDTAAALAAKTDLKARARERAKELEARVRQNPAPVAAAAGALALALLGVRAMTRRGS